MTLVILEAALHDKIWGGTALKDFHFPIKGDHVGEAWAIAAHKNGESIIKDGPFAGQTLTQLWQDNPNLFGGHEANEAFPLLIKILDAHQDLSIQVHPNDTQSREKYGKTECWYILDATPNAKIYYGHYAQSRDELKAMVEKEDWDHMLRTVPVKKRDFFYVPAGTFHALGAGIVALETQQSSDTTYRFYDFDRVDATTGQKRDLQIADALDVTTVPHHDPVLKQTTTIVDQTIVTRLVTSVKFTVEKLSVRGLSMFNLAHHYELFTVIDGAGRVNETAVKKGDSFILFDDEAISYALDGDMTIIKSFVTKDDNPDQRF